MITKEEMLLEDISMLANHQIRMISVFDQINSELVSIGNIFQKHLTNHMYLCLYLYYLLCVDKAV